MPLIWFSCAFFTGILLADQLAWPARGWFLLMGLGALLLSAVGWMRQRLPGKGGRRWFLLLCVVWAGFGLGGMRYLLSLPDWQDRGFIGRYTDQDLPLTVTGWTAAYPDRRDTHLNLVVEVKSISFREEDAPLPVEGRILVRAPGTAEAEFGDRLTLQGFLRTPPEGEEFSYRTYLQRQGIYAFLSTDELNITGRGEGFFLRRWLYKLRTRLLENLYRLWPDPESSLLAGILLGVETGIPDRVQQAFRQTGTSHVIAISGFNITLVAGLFSRSFNRLFNPRFAALAAGIGICLYTVLVGADPAVVRAAVMGGLSLFARQIGRRQHGLNAAALASLLMALVNPQIPWSISFQLSLAATLGLILYADPLAQAFYDRASRLIQPELARRVSQPVSEYLLFTLAAQVTTFPVMMVHFHTFSLSTFVANPVILPVQPPIMILGGLALLLSVIWFPVGRVAAPLVFPFVAFTIRMVEWVSRLPIRSFHTGDAGATAAVLYYFLLFGLTAGWQLLSFLPAVLKPSLRFGGAALAVFLVWRSVFALPDGKLHLTFCSVGGGSAVLVEAPGGERILINGEPAASRLSDCLGRRLPPFSRELDLLVIASPIPEDLLAVERNLERFPPERVIWLGEQALCVEAESLQEKLQEKKIPIVQGQIGQEVVYSRGGKLVVLEESARGGSVLLSYQHFRVLLPFGLDEVGRERLRQGRDIGPISVLLLADRGYQASNPPGWIWNLQPQLLVFSGEGDGYGSLPDSRLIADLAGYSLLRTDQQGAVEIISDGIEMQVRVEKLN